MCIVPRKANQDEYEIESRERPSMRQRSQLMYKYKILGPRQDSAKCKYERKASRQCLGSGTNNEEKAETEGINERVVIERMDE